MLHFEGKEIQGLKNLWQAILHNDLRWAFYTLTMVVSYSLVDKRGMDLFHLYYPEQPSLRNGFFLYGGINWFILYNFYLFLTHAKNEILDLGK
ncbi:MAG: hypothetical protein CM1200mP16_13080 [Nitrospina sp.]|nr:MAG: hypothetical protein CM1200mP16_13080 [Nitrospina sp.]